MLFRAIAGLWPWGAGEIVVPDRDRMMFMPQRPYCKRSASGPAQAAARAASRGCQFQGKSSAMRRAGWSAMRMSTSAR
jgi:vitamin B12/bleomycin/antimicrobial peptide transport system ATP-binding/permease protein